MRITACRYCGKGIPLCSQPKHHADDCPRFEVECQNTPSCGCFVPRELLERHMKHECENRIVPCNLCGEDVYWRNMENHMKEVCPEAVISCPHASLSGCVTRLKRKDMAKHAQDANAHLEKAFMQIRKLTQTVSALTNRISSVERLGGGRAMGVDAGRRTPPSITGTRRMPVPDSAIKHVVLQTPIHNKENEAQPLQEQHANAIQQILD